MFPKTQWPTPDLCPTCHEERSGIHVWNEPTVLDFLKRHYGADNLSLKYALEPSPPKEPPAAPDADAHIPAPEAHTQAAGAQPPLDLLPPAGNRSQVQSQLQLQVQVQPQLNLRLHPRDQVQAQAQAQGVGAQREAGLSVLALGFSSVDMSLCVLLYAASCVFLMFMFFFFRARSRRWKVRTNRPFV